MYDTCICLMFLEIDLLSLSIVVGLKLPPFKTLFVVRWVSLNLRFLKMYDTCM